MAEIASAICGYRRAGIGWAMAIAFVEVILLVPYWHAADRLTMPVNTALILAGAYVVMIFAVNAAMYGIGLLLGRKRAR